jgi:N-acyl-D-amino-acid deacylase
MKRLLVAALLLTSCATAPTRPMLDLKITNGRILDGTGAPWFRGDVGVRGDAIVAIGDLRDATAASTIDAGGNIVAPGFIDLLGQSQASAISDKNLEAKVRQGVTTEVTGEHFTPGPVGPSAASDRNRWSTLGEYLDLLDRQGAAINFALFIGAANARQLVVGDTNRPPTMDEMRQMEAIVEQGMREGAIGLSTSLIYVPSMYTTTDELINLARVAARYGGTYFSHIRDEGDGINDALEEAFRIGREAQIPVNIWHVKVSGRRNFGRMPEVLERIQRARSEGIDAAANMYPYAASSTNLAILAPNWALEGGYDDFVKRLQDPAVRPRLAEELRKEIENRGPRGVYVARIRNPQHKPYEKKFVEEIAALMGLPPEEALIRIYIENESAPQAIFFSMSEDDVQVAVKHPLVSFGADSGSPTPAMRAAGNGVHPRAYGTFPRVLGRYVREMKLLTLEEAVRKMTSQAALRAQIADRGVLRRGMKADIVIFDPDTIRDLSTYEDPHHFSEGVSSLIVNGVPVLREGAMTGALPGRTIRGPGYVKR